MYLLFQGFGQHLRSLSLNLSVFSSQRSLEYFDTLMSPTAKFHIWWCKISWVLRLPLCYVCIAYYFSIFKHNRFQELIDMILIAELLTHYAQALLSEVVFFVVAG